MPATTIKEGLKLVPLPVINQANDGGTGTPTDKGEGSSDEVPKGPTPKKPQEFATSSLAGGQAEGGSPTASPEAALQKRFIDIPVNLFTGTAQVPIPIYTLTEGNLIVPIALNYNGSGVKVHEVASWTGLNFILSAGANIVRIVRGIPDEGKLDYSSFGSNSSNVRKGYYQWGNYADNNNDNDSEPDLFILNINGGSYKFIFESVLRYDFSTGQNYRKAVFFPDADIDVRVTSEHIIQYGDNVANQNIGHFVDWKVTLPDGNIYNFSGVSDAIESSFEIEAKTAQTQNVYEGGSELYRYIKNNQITSAWNVTSMVSPFGNHIDFSYTGSRYAYFKINEQETQTNNCTFNAIYDRQTVNKVYVSGSSLTEINSQTVKVKVNDAVWNCIPNPNWSSGDPEEDRYICSFSTSAGARVDVDTWDRNPMSSTAVNTRAKLFSKISVQDKVNTSNKVLTWTFEYENKVSDYYGQEPLPFSYTTNQIGETHHKRILLKKINLPDNNFYRFTYGTLGLASRFATGIDHWGFFNGAANFLLIGKDYTRPCVSSLLGNRETNTVTNYATAYVLDSVISSTGMATTFTYDNHEANNFTGKVGGSRIRKVSSLDLISGLKTVKTYDYLQADGISSSGFMALKPLYHFTDKNDNEQWNSGIYSQLLGLSGIPAVGYSRVIEKTISPITPTNSLGYTVSEFNQSTSEINLVIPQGTGTNLPYTVRPWTNHFFQDYSNGVPTRVASYKSNNQIVNEKLTTYGSGTSDNAISYGFKSFRMNGLNYNFEQSYSESLAKYRLKTETVKAYSQDGTNPVENTSTYTYKDEMSSTYRNTYQGKHNQVVKTESTDSYGYLNETYNKYSADFYFGNDSTLVRRCYDYDGFVVDCTDPNVNPNIFDLFYVRHEHIPIEAEAKGIYQLKQKGIKSATIETFVKKNSKVVSASYQTFYDTATANHQVGLGKDSYMAENMPLTSFTEVSYVNVPGSEGMVKDDNYYLRASVEKYNPLGMPAVTQTLYGSRDSTVYDATNTLVVEHHNNTQAYDKNRTKTEYTTIIFGVSKETATNDLEVRKEYYDNGKVKQIKDKDGNVLKHYQYYYRGQDDADPKVTSDKTKNRIITRVPRITTADALNLDFDQCMISVQYLDGSNRILENVALKASPNQKDMISGVTFYDEYARPIKNVLMVEGADADGGYVADTAVLRIAKAFYQDDAPFTEILEYESSPLSRAFKTYGVGKAWRDNNKFTEVKYETATGIKKFTVAHDASTVTVGTYSTYELTKKTLIDERGSMVVEYTDKSGNVVQKDVQVDGTASNPVFLTTANIFDDISRLRYTLNPKAYSLLSILSSFDETNANFEPNVYAYRYDGRNRISEKKMPSIGTSRTIYNRLNQAVLIQDDDEASRNTWNYFKYDGQGRIVLEGQLQTSTRFATLQRSFKFFSDAKQYEERNTDIGNVKQYTNRSYPNGVNDLIDDASLKKVSYFDDYGWRTPNSISGSVADYDFQENSYSPTAYSATNARGMGTGGLSKIEIYGDFIFPFCVYHDDKNRTIQTIGYHNLKARNQSDVQYNFVGEVLQNQMIYRKEGAIDYIRTTEQTLDHIGRRKELFYSLKEGTTNKVARFRMSLNSYDNIGRLRVKSIQPNNNNAQSSIQAGLWTNSGTWVSGNVPTITDPVVINQGHTITIPTGQIAKAGSLYDKGTLQNYGTLQLGSLPANQQNAALQTIDYTYNVLGKIRGVNLDATGNVNTSADKLFSYRLDYFEDNRYYDGSISKQTWKSYGQDQNTRAYQFYYDKASRLTGATFTGGKAGEDFTIPRITYDVNGNITFMSRMGKNGTNTVKIDSLDYQYLNNGDKLQSVTDNAPNAQSGGFKNGSNSGDDYDYYVDGKLKKDLNRNISLIEYNFLDLVKKITLVNGNTIEYWYTSTGTKRQTKRVKAGQLDSYTLYDGEMIYTYSGSDPSLNNFVVSEVQNEEGRFVNGRLEYGYTDHLGNLRLSYRDSLGIAVIVQQNAYDAWGMEIRPLRFIQTGATEDKYTWNGKEDLSGDGLEDWSDFGWRIEDRTLGRWFTPDPADQFESVSSYAYCVNNPVSHIDPDGRILPAVAVGALIGAGISALTYTASVAFSEGGFNNWNWGSFAKSVGIGAVSGAITSGIGNAYGDVGGFGKEIHRAFTHASIQASISTITGGDAKSAFLSGFLGSAIGSGTNGLDDGARFGISALSGAGISTAIEGGNFWENLAISSIVVGANHLMHKNPKPKSKKDQLDLSTIKKNLFGLTYPGGDNPKTFGKKYDYSYVPEDISEYPAIGHDRRYDNLKVEGLSGLMGDTRAIGADYKFVHEEMVAANINLIRGNYGDALRAFGLGTGLGTAALFKTAIQFTRYGYGSGTAQSMAEVLKWYTISSNGVTNTPSK